MLRVVAVIGGLFLTLAAVASILSVVFAFAMGPPVVKITQTSMLFFWLVAGEVCWWYVLRGHKASDKSRIRRGCVWGISGLLIGRMILISLSTAAIDDPDIRIAISVMSSFLGFAIGTLAGVASGYIASSDRWLA